jgi:hypothetical protein
MGTWDEVFDRFFHPTGDRFSLWQKIDNEQEARGREKEYTRGRH